jgi:hypothetical protein
MAILANRDVIAVDQDKAGKQEIRVRELEGGDRAVTLFNRGSGC